MGPELVDEAKLFILEDESSSDEEWKVFDTTGRTVANVDKKIPGFRCSLKIPKNKNQILVSICNSDNTALVLRFYDESEYFFQTQKINLVNGSSIMLFFISIIVMFFAWIFTHNKKWFFIFLTSLCVFVYQLCTTGIGASLIWNGIASVRFFSRLSYIATTLGFVFVLSLIFECLNDKGKTILYRNISFMLIGWAGLFCLLYVVLPKINIIYWISVFVMIAACLFELVVGILEIKNRRSNFTLMMPWFFFFVVLIFRQILQLIRKSHNYSFVNFILDNDYYFCYGAAFFLMMIFYGVIFCKWILKNRVLRAGEETEIKSETISQSIDIEEIFQRFNLTNREIEVAKILFSDGKTTKEIAADLNVSVSTVATHIQHVFEKVGVSSRIAFYQKISDETKSSR